MKIFKRWGKLFIKKECFYCRKKFRVYQGKLIIDKRGETILWGRCICPRCKKECYISCFDVKELQNQK